MLIVETVSPEGIAHQSGIQPGDRLLSYAGQPLLSPFHLQALEENTFTDQPLPLELEREGHIRDMTVPTGKLGISVRPEMPDDISALYEQARQEQQAGRINEAAQQLEYAARQAAMSGEKAESVYLFVEAGVLYEQLGTWEQAINVYQAARQADDGEEDLAGMVQFYLKSGSCYENVSDYAKAVSCYEQACALAEEGGLPIWKARGLNHLGSIARQRGDLTLAHDYSTHALAISERLAPDSLEVAHSCNQLGATAYDSGDLALAEDYHLRALALKEKLAPGSLDVAASLHMLAIVAWRRGDLGLAEEYLHRALALKEKLAPGSLDVAASLTNLGLVAFSRGTLGLAEDYYRRAIAIYEKLASGSMQMAATLNNLGRVVWRRGDLVAAEDYYHRALAIKEKLAPESLEVAYAWNNLGLVAHDRGDLVLAEEYLLRALAIKERLAPDSMDAAHSLMNLGGIAMNQGDPAMAQDYFDRGLAIMEKQAPGSLEVAFCLGNLGEVALHHGDLNLSDRYFRRAQAIYKQLAPRSLEFAQSLEQIGRVYLRQHQPQQGLSKLYQALEVVENQRLDIQATEARALLLAQQIGKYVSLLQAHLDLNQPSEAFSVLERLRARSLSELLAERHLSFSDMSQEFIQQQHELDQQLTEAYSALAKLSLSDQEQVEQLHVRLHLLERQKQELTARIRAASPGYAALHYPKPLDAKATLSALEAGTLLLSFLVGDEKSYLFTVTNKALSCHELPIGQNALQEKVQAFREALDIYSLENTLSDAIEQGHQLYEMLLSPAQAAIDKARRLLICADGPLHLLPFAALVVKSGKKPVYLGQRKPLHTTFSMTVYAQTRQAALSRQDHPGNVAEVVREKTDQALEKLGQAAAGIWQQGWKVLAVGDPVYATGGRKLALSGARSNRKKQTGNSELAGLRSRGLSLDPLPHTREEVEAIASLFGEQATVRTGEAATKTAAIQESEQADIIHFACHGWLDAKMPLSSGLILSQPEALGKKASEADNGLLQAFEIFKLKLKADLVVLSACQTGLGAEIRGEGLIGLTRAFTYAGAKSVLVSLWEINDASTAMFMQAFYQAVKEGKSKDKALQQAIKKMSKQGKWQHPFFWSAFSLVGDWR